jgi:hypothetical protein
MSGPRAAKLTLSPAHSGHARRPSRPAWRSPAMPDHPECRADRQQQRRWRDHEPSDRGERAKAVSRSLSVVAFTTKSCRPSVRAAAWRSAMTDWVTARFHNASRRRGGRRARYEMVINLKTAKALTRPIARKSYRWRHDTVCQSRWAGSGKRSWWYAGKEP